MKRYKCANLESRNPERKRLGNSEWAGIHDELPNLVISQGPYIYEVRLDGPVRGITRNKGERKCTGCERGRSSKKTGWCANGKWWSPDTLLLNRSLLH